MTNRIRPRSRRKNKPQEERDIALMVVLAFFNLGSGATTILGAMQILPIKYLAWTLGGAVQLMLFILQAGLAANRTPLRKWLAIMVLATASVYTSFFTYYDKLAQGTNEKRGMDMALKAHNRLISEVYTPMEDHLRDLQQEALTLRETAKAEQDRGIDTGLIGYGDQARKFDKLALEKEIEAKNFLNTVNQLRPLFEYNPKNLRPVDILNKDRKALSSAPKDFRENYPELKRGEYIDEDLEFSLLAPYLKVVKNQEEAALLALIIAIGVDGMAIMLGTAIVVKLIPPEERRSPIAIVGNSIANFIRDIKKSSAKVDNASRESFLAEDEDLQAAVEYVTLNVKGKGSNFLNDFYYAILEIEPHTINYSALTQKYRNYDNMQNPVRAFIDKLREPRRLWVIRNQENTEWMVPPEHYHQLVNWLQKEIKRQKSLEAEKKIDYGFGFSEEETTIQFQMPKMPVNPNSN